MTDPSIQLRPVVEDDLAMFRRFATEPGLIGLDWAGFRDAQAPARRFATDGYLGSDDGRLVVEVEQERVAAGFVSWHAGSHGGMTKHWEVGIALLPEGRSRRRRTSHSSATLRWWRTGRLTSCCSARRGSLAR
jgi:hypothetical protein